MVNKACLIFVNFCNYNTFFLFLFTRAFRISIARFFVSGKFLLNLATILTSLSFNSISTKTEH